MVEYNARVDEVAGAIMDRVREVLVEKKVDYTEYKAFLQWAREAAETGEWRVFIDNFFEWTIELNTYENADGSEGTVEGPYFIPDALLLTEKPFVMPMRPNEPGVPMVLNGEVRRLNGEPISGAHIDLWQADDGGRYAGFDFAEPRFNPARAVAHERAGTVPGPDHPAGPVPDSHQRPGWPIPGDDRVPRVAAGPLPPHRDGRGLPDAHDPVVLPRR